MDFNSHMNQFLVNSQCLPIFIWRFWMMSDNTNDGSEFINANLPDMQIGDHGVGIVFNCLVNLMVQVTFFGFFIQQNNSRLANK